MLTTPIPTSWSPLEWDTVKTRHTSTHDLQAEPKIWTPRLAANWLSGKFMIQLDTGENQVSGWSVSAGCRLAGRNEDRYQDWSMNAAKNHFIQPSICFQNKATNRNNRKGDNDDWPRTSAPNSCQPSIWGKTWKKRFDRSLLGLMPKYQPKALTPLELLKSSWGHSIEEKSSLARPMAASHWHATCALSTNWWGCANVSVESRPWLQPWSLLSLLCHTLILARICDHSKSTQILSVGICWNKKQKARGE